MSGRKWVIGGMATAALLAWGIAVRAQTPVAGGKPPAVVNGETITQADLEQALRQGGPTPVSLTEAQKRQYQMQALYFLIDQVLMRQYLARNAKPVDMAEVGRKIGEMEAALKKQGKTLADVCRDTHQTEAQLRNNVAQHLQWYNFANERLSDADIEAYYKQYKDLFDKVTVRMSEIFLPLPTNATETERAQARAKLSELRAQVLAGKIDFAAAAKAHSRGPTAEVGGDLGFVPRKWVVHENVARVGFAMKVGEISDVIESEFGLHVIRITDRKAGEASELAKIKDQVRELCIEDMYMVVLQQVRKASKIEVNLP